MVLDRVSVTLSGGQVAAVAGSADDQSDQDSRPIKFAPAFSGAALWRWDQGDFIIDLDTLIFNRARTIIDYNHEEDQILGYADNFAVGQDGLTADGHLIRTREGDRADQIHKLIRSGVPFEVSPTLDLYTDKMEELGRGSSATVNGRTVTGPITIYHDVALRGVSICPFGTDSETAVAALKREERKKDEERKKEIEVKKRNTLRFKTKLAEDPDSDKINKDLPAEDIQPDEPQYTAYPDLEEFISQFGLEKGVEYYRRGLTLEEAQAEDYAELKAARLAEEDLPPETDLCPDPEKDQVVPATLSAALNKMNLEIQIIKNTLRRGDRTGLSASPDRSGEGEDMTGLDAWQKLAMANRTRGTVKR